MIIGEHHVDHAGQLAARIKSPGRIRGGTAAMAIDQTNAKAMFATGAMTVVAVVKVCRIERGICFQREHVIPG